MAQSLFKKLKPRAGLSNQSRNLFVRQITSDGFAEGVHTYNAPIVPEQSIRGGVQVRKADAENNTAQGNGTLAGTQIEIINNNANTVTVNGVTYQPGEVVLTLTTSEDGNGCHCCGYPSLRSLPLP